MRGAYEVIITSGRVQFKLLIRRNLTILKGDSATGKTTLVDMVANYEELGPGSGVDIKCDAPCVVLSGRNWQRTLSAITNSIVFIDEGNPFVASEDFARAAKHSDNYYVIVSREALPMLPYSVDEVYGLRNNTRRLVSKYPKAYRVYASTFRIYENNYPGDAKPELVIVEDSGAGYDFFLAAFNKVNIPCVAAGGKGSVFKIARDAEASNILVIADGAAFGPEMERVLSLKFRKNIKLFLPESFEWLILKSGLVDGSTLQTLLEDPSPHIESSRYFSWEKFFTHELIALTQGTYLSYEKGGLNPAYLNERERAAIENVMPDLGL